MRKVADHGWRKLLWRVVIGIFVAAGLQFPCLPPYAVLAAEQASASTELVVFAAESLSEPFREISKQFEILHPELRVVYNFGGSAALRTQLEQGVHADVFAPADTIQMELAKKSGVIQGNTAVFAKNRLVVIVPAANTAQIKTFCDLEKPGIKLDLAQATVPIGNYSRQAIAKAQAVCGSDFEQRLLKNIVSEEENAKQVVAKIQRGEIDAGFVYASDVTAKINDEIHTIPIEEAYNQIATYPIALTSAAKNRAVGEAFIRFVLSPEGQVVLGGHGFMPAATPDPQLSD